MTQINHDFFDPLTVDTIKHLIVLDDLKRAQAAATASTENYVKSLNSAASGGIVEGDTEAACKGCSDCCGTEDTAEYLSVREYAEDFGITLGTGALTEMTNAAVKESVRQGKAMSTVECTRVFHPEVLKVVFEPLLKLLNRV